MIMIGMGITLSLYILYIGHVERKNAEKREEIMKIPFFYKYIFYISITLAILQFIFHAFNLIFCNQIISSLPSTYGSFANKTSFIIYIIIMAHLFLGLLCRLYFTFHGSLYAKKKEFYIITIVIFITIVLIGIIGIFLKSPILVICAVFSYWLESLWLLSVFIRHLMDLITNRIVDLHFRTSSELRRKTAKLQLSFEDEKLIKLISKYLVLGVSSFLMKILVLIAVALLVFEIDYQDIMYPIVKLLIMIDVMTNIVYIYLQYNFADKEYRKLCACMDTIIGTVSHDVAVGRIRGDTLSFYMDKYKESVDMTKEQRMKKLSMDIPKLKEIQTHSTNMSMPTIDEVLADMDIDFAELERQTMGNSKTSDNVEGDGQDSSDDTDSEVEDQLKAFGETSIQIQEYDVLSQQNGMKSHNEEDTID